MIKELYEVLKELVEPENTGYSDSRCNLCGCRYINISRTAFQDDEIDYLHATDCPITKGRALVKQLEALPGLDQIDIRPLTPEEIDEIKKQWKQGKTYAIPERPDPTITPLTSHGNFPSKFSHDESWK